MDSMIGLCPYEGCTVRGPKPWLETLHVGLLHVRCVCGYIGTQRGFPAHRAQVNRRLAAEGLGPTTHEVVEEMPPLDRGA
jgi:hypothetical protein